jgi:hypothetical protein
VIRYQRIRNPAQYRGELLQVLDDGVRFVAAQPLRDQEMLNVWVQKPGAPYEGVIRVHRRRLLSRPDEDLELEVTGLYLMRDSVVDAPDRRRFPRVPADFPMTFRRQGGRRIFSGRVRDVSRGGWRFVGPERLQVGEIIVAHAEAGTAPQLERSMAAAMVVVHCALDRPIDAEVEPTGESTRRLAPVRKRTSSGRVARILKPRDLERLGAEEPRKPGRMYEVRARFVIQ